MPYFVISGKLDCPNFAHAIHVAQYLSDKLPNFLYNKIEKSRVEWPPYIESLNVENKWYITESPLIWKEISMWGGKKYLIGGLSEFWEYVYCYYGLESVIPKKELRMLAADNCKIFEEKLELANKQQKKMYNITILASFSYEILLLLRELLEVESLWKVEVTKIKLFDSSAKNNEKRINALRDIASYINDQTSFVGRDIVIVLEDEVEAIKNCDILINMNDFRRLPVETAHSWLSRCFSKMQHLADVINQNAQPNLQVIISDHGPVCFLATVLVEFCTRLRLSNIVAVTADEGLSIIDVVSKKSGIPVDRISAPPVWGFVGISHFVDEKNIVFKANMYRPYKRSLTAPSGSTLPLGTIKSELRLMSSVLVNSNHYEIMKEVIEKRRKANWYSNIRFSVQK